MFQVVMFTSVAGGLCDSVSKYTTSGPRSPCFNLRVTSSIQAAEPFFKIAKHLQVASVRGDSYGTSPAVS